MHTLRLTTGASVLALALTLAACDPGNQAGPPATGIATPEKTATQPNPSSDKGQVDQAHNEVDTMFAQMMMTSWLEAWKEDTTPPEDMTGHGGMDMNGLSQEEAMGQLNGLPGAEFNRRFLELMIAHHEGAVTMARDELRDGQNPQARELAQKIIDDQQAEIVKMRGMLQRL